MQRVNPFLELLKLFSQAPDCRGLWANCFQGGKGKWSERLVASAAFLPRCLCCCSAPGSRSCHISVDSSQAEPSVLTSYFLGVRWKFLKNGSRRQKDTYLPTYHTQSVRGETRRDYRMFPICFRAKRKSKRELKCFSKTWHSSFFRSGPKWKWHLKRMPALPGICLKTGCCCTAVTDAVNKLVRNTGFKENPPLWGHEMRKLGTFKNQKIW